MKRAALFHGTDGAPDLLWFPWLKNALEAEGYEVFAPLLPENHTPNMHVYEAFLKSSGWDFGDSILVGHSSGATTILNLLSTDWFPKVKAVVLVGTFLNEKWTKSVEWYDPGQFDNLFLDNYDPQKLKQKTSHFYFVHGDDDPYCDIGDARKLSQEVGGKLIVIKGGHHIAASSGITELPQVIEALKQDDLL